MFCINQIDTKTFLKTEYSFLWPFIWSNPNEHFVSNVASFHLNPILNDIENSKNIIYTPGYPQFDSTSTIFKMGFVNVNIWTDFETPITKYVHLNMEYTESNHKLLSEYLQEKLKLFNFKCFNNKCFNNFFSGFHPKETQLEYYLYNDNSNINFSGRLSFSSFSKTGEYAGIQLYKIEPKNLIGLINDRPSFCIDETFFLPSLACEYNLIQPNEESGIRRFDECVESLLRRNREKLYILQLIQIYHAFTARAIYLKMKNYWENDDTEIDWDREARDAFDSDSDYRAWKDY